MKSNGRLAASFVIGAAVVASAYLARSGPAAEPPDVADAVKAGVDRVAMLFAQPTPTPARGQVNGLDKGPVIILCERQAYAGPDGHTLSKFDYSFSDRERHVTPPDPDGRRTERQGQL